MARTPPLKPVFPLRLKQARQAAGLSLEKLGTLAGIDIDVARSRVHRYENGIHSPDESTARALARALGIPLAALYADSEGMAQLIAAASELPESELLRLAEQIKSRKK